MEVATIPTLKDAVKVQCKLLRTVHDTEQVFNKYRWLLLLTLLFHIYITRYSMLHFYDLVFTASLSTPIPSLIFWDPYSIFETLFFSSTSVKNFSVYDTGTRLVVAKRVNLKSPHYKKIIFLVTVYGGRC